MQFSDLDAHTSEADGLIPPIHILTLQGHPEFTTGIVQEIIRKRGKSGVMNRDTVENGLIRANDRNDGDGIIGRAIWEVLLQRSATISV